MSSPILFNALSLSPVLRQSELREALPLARLAFCPLLSAHSGRQDRGSERDAAQSLVFARIAPLPAPGWTLPLLAGGPPSAARPLAPRRPRGNLPCSRASGIRFSRTRGAADLRLSSVKGPPAGALFPSRSRQESLAALGLSCLLSPGAVALSRSRTPSAPVAERLRVPTPAMFRGGSR